MMGPLNLMMRHAMIAMTTTSNTHTHTRYSHTYAFDLHAIYGALHCGDHIECDSMWPPHLVELKLFNLAYYSERV